jgi:hypothetical protein
MHLNSVCLEDDNLANHFRVAGQVCTLYTKPTRETQNNVHETKGSDAALGENLHFNNIDVPEKLIIELVNNFDVTGKLMKNINDKDSWHLNMSAYLVPIVKGIKNRS